MPYGYHGRCLRVDLEAGRAEPRPLTEDVLRNWIGGSGLGTWLLHAEGRREQDPLGPDAPLIFAFSPLVGSPLTTSAKFAVVAKSPLTQRINDSLASSYFAIAGKKTGYDALVIVGRCDRLSSLVITPDGIRIEPAERLARLSSAEAAERLRADLGPQFRVAAIGPAGENLVRYATISSDRRHAGRGGLGAVLGSKRLKAIAVAGDRLTPFAHPRRLIDYSKRLSQKSFGPATAKYRELGTASNLLVFNRLGTLPTRNFREGQFQAEWVDVETIAGAQERPRASCAACTIGCEHLYPRKDRAPVRLEYENVFALGALCGVTEADVVLEASALCDELGLDTISAGATIAFAMECAEQGLLDAPGLRFGAGQAMLEALRQIAGRRGLGDLLAEGSRLAAAEIGGGSADFAPHVKGLELPGYEPRALQTMALGFAVGTRGADHNRSGAYEVDFSDDHDRLRPDLGSVAAAVHKENEAAVMDSLILCRFLRGVFDDRLAAMAEMLELVTGGRATGAELERTAGRLIAARKLYNIGQGWTPDEDTLPARFFTDPLPAGASQGALLSRRRLKELVGEYNRRRGWTPEGWIPEQQVAELGLPPDAVGSCGACLR